MRKCYSTLLSKTFEAEQRSQKPLVARYYTPQPIRRRPRKKLFSPLPTIYSPSNEVKPLRTVCLELRSLDFEVVTYCRGTIMRRLRSRAALQSTACAILTASTVRMSGAPIVSRLMLALILSLCSSSTLTSKYEAPHRMERQYMRFYTPQPMRRRTELFYPLPPPAYGPNNEANRMQKVRLEL